MTEAHSPGDIGRYVIVDQFCDWIAWIMALM